MWIFGETLSVCPARVPFAYRDLVADDLLAPVLFAVLARNRRPLAFPDLGKDFFTGCRLGGLFETALARLTAFRTGRPSAAAFPQEHRSLRQRLRQSGRLCCRSPHQLRPQLFASELAESENL